MPKPQRNKVAGIHIYELATWWLKIHKTYVYGVLWCLRITPTVRLAARGKRGGKPSLGLSWDQLDDLLAKLRALGHRL